MTKISTFKCFNRKDPNYPNWPVTQALHRASVDGLSAPAAGQGQGLGPFAVDWLSWDYTMCGGGQNQSVVSRDVTETTGRKKNSRGKTLKIEPTAVAP